MEGKISDFQRTFAYSDYGIDFDFDYDKYCSKVSNYGKHKAIDITYSKAKEKQINKRRQRNKNKKTHR